MPVVSHVAAGFGEFGEYNAKIQKSKDVTIRSRHQTDEQNYDLQDRAK